MTSLYRTESSDPRTNAQRNLSGRTHYVDEGTLRWHKSRILSAKAVDGGLLFAIVESVALDMHNTRRGCRYVVFDLFGNVVSRVDLEGCWSRSSQATKALWAFLDTVDAKALTVAAIERQESNHAREMADLRAMLDRTDAKAA